MFHNSTIFSSKWEPQNYVDDKFEDEQKSNSKGDLKVIKNKFLCTNES